MLLTCIQWDIYSFNTWTCHIPTSNNRFGVKVIYTCHGWLQTLRQSLFIVSIQFQQVCYLNLKEFKNIQHTIVLSQEIYVVVEK